MPQGCILNDFGAAPGQSLIRFLQKTGFSRLHQLAHAVHRCADDRHPQGHGLQGAHGRALPEGGHQQNPGVLEQSIGIGLEAQQMDTVPGGAVLPAFAEVLLQLRVCHVRAADDQGVQVRQENCQLFQNPEHPQRIFGLGHPAQEHRMAFLPAVRRCSLIPKGLGVDDIAQDGAFACNGFAEIEAVHG